MESERHNVNLSRQVWGELKLRAVQEGMSASELIAYVAEKRVKGESSRSFSRYQERDPDDDRLGRTVFFPEGAWKQVQEAAARYETSASALIDYWLRLYLGLIPEDYPITPETMRAENTVRVGEERVYLGDHPVKIDLQPGKKAQG